MANSVPEFSYFISFNPQNSLMRCCCFYSPVITGNQVWGGQEWGVAMIYPQPQSNEASKPGPQGCGEMSLTRGLGDTLKI